MPTTHWAMLSHPVSELATGIEKIFFPASDATSNAGPCAANSGASAAAATSAFSSSSFSADTPPSAPPDAAESAVEPAVVSAGASAVESAVVPAVESAGAAALVSAVESLLLASSSLPHAAATSDRATTDATTSRRRVDRVEVRLIEVGLIEVGLMVQSPFLLMVHVWNASHEQTPRESWLVGGCTIHGRRAPLPISHSPSHVLASPRRPPDRLDCPIIRTIESGCRNHGS